MPIWKHWKVEITDHELNDSMPHRSWCSIFSLRSLRFLKYCLVTPKMKLEFWDATPQTKARKKVLLQPFLQLFMFTLIQVNWVIRHELREAIGRHPLGIGVQLITVDLHIVQWYTVIYKRMLNHNAVSVWHNPLSNLETLSKIVVRKFIQKPRVEGTQGYNKNQPKR